MPKISVIIPSYNHAAYISEAVHSVLIQSEGDLELIVVDDGSTDSSLKVLERFTDHRLRVIAQTNQGAHAAINRGLNESTGEFLAILNSDDAYHPRRLEKILSALQANPHLGLVGSFIEIIDEHNRHLGIKHGFQDSEPWPLESPQRSFRAGDDLAAALLTENYWATTSNFVFRRSIYEQVGEFRPLRYAHDWDFALRVSGASDLLLLPEALVRYRVHPRNTIRENQVAMIFEICWVLAVHLPQHVSQASFMDGYTLDKRIDQLLNSIYTYGCERVLSVMLLQGLYTDPDLALKLLDPQDPTRVKYLEFIDRQIAGKDLTQGGQDRKSLASLIRRLFTQVSS